VRCYYFLLGPVLTRSDQVKAARRKSPSKQCFGNITHGNDAASSQDYPFHFWCLVRETKNSARGHELGNLIRSNGKSPFSQAQEDERLQFEFG
jgi:hypothetical protein